MMKDNIELPPLPDDDTLEEAIYEHTRSFIQHNTYDTIRSMMQEYAIAAIKADRQSGGMRYGKRLKLGNLVTLNLDGYPALGRFFVQIWEGDSVVARVYGDSQEEVLYRANDLLARYVQTDATEGWQLVPKIPTKGMLLAGKHTIKGADTTF